MAGQLSPELRLSRLRRAGLVALAVALASAVATAAWFAQVSGQPRARFVVRPDQPVFGVAVGSPVRLRGAVVGEVSAVRLWSPPAGGRLRPELALSVDTRRHPELAGLAERVPEGLRVELIPVNPASGFLEVDLVWRPRSTPVRATAESDELPALPALSAGLGRLASSLADLAATDPVARAARIDARLGEAGLALGDPAARARAAAAAAAELRSLAARAESAADAEVLAARRARLAEAREGLAQLAQRLAHAADQLASSGPGINGSLRGLGLRLRAAADDLREAESSRREAP